MALKCKDWNDSVTYYEKYFGAKPCRRAKARKFCFVDITGADGKINLRSRESLQQAQDESSRHRVHDAERLYHLDFVLT